MFEEFPKDLPLLFKIAAFKIKFLNGIFIFVRIDKHAA